MSGNVVSRLTFDMRSRCQVEALWQAHDMGNTYDEIGEENGVSFRSVMRYIHKTGGKREPAWKDTVKCLTFEERIEIKALLHERVRETARRLGRSRSTVSREIRRGGGRSARFPKAYEPVATERAACANRRRPKPLTFRPAAG